MSFFRRKIWDQSPSPTTPALDSKERNSSLTPGASTTTPTTSSFSPNLRLPKDLSRGTQTSADDSPLPPTILRAHHFTSEYQWYGCGDEPMGSQRRSMHKFLQISRERYEERSRSPKERYHLELPTFLNWAKYKEETRWQSRRDQDQAADPPSRTAEQELDERRADGYGGPILVGDTDLWRGREDWPRANSRSFVFGCELPDKWCGRLANPYAWAMIKHRLQEFWKAAGFRGADRHGSTAILGIRREDFVIWLLLIVVFAYWVAIIRDVKCGAWMAANAATQPELDHNWHSILGIRVPCIVHELAYVNAFRMAPKSSRKV